MSESQTEKALLARDAAELLYLHGVGGLFVTAVAGIALVALQPDALVQPRLILWLIAMMLTIGARAFDMIAARQRRRKHDWDGQAAIRRFTRGVAMSAIIWAAFPILFFHGLTNVERTTMAIIVSAMAGGGATVLAAVQRLAVGYCAAMLLPTSLMFLLTPGRENAFLGVLAFVFFVVIASSSRVTHHATMSAIRLNRANQILMVEMERERERGAHINAELTTAQAELSETLETLEDRITARTADLEHEIRERERYGRELARLAARDPLTGLYNRATLADRLDTELLRTRGASESCAVLFLDLDKFKEVNDLKGHHWGDHVLREVAQRLTDLLPANAFLARWGGDEFVFVLTAIDVTSELTAIADRLRRSICGPISIGAETVRVDATIGIAVFPYHGRTTDELIGAADMAMYAAKESGRGRVQIFEPALAEAMSKRMQLEEALRTAIVENALWLEFQPIVAASSHRCEALEALVRWNHPTHGAISPGEFIPLAERSGDIISIGRWVLLHGCLAASSWSSDPPPAVSINVSVAQLVAGTVLDDVCDALAGSGLEARRLHLEVTESLFASDHGQIVPTLIALRAMGVRISLDDFGTGFSSLSSLRALPIDTLKIDKSFVDHVDGESGSIVKGIRALALALDIELVGEGVETVTQAALLLAMGVHFLQGYLFAKPLPAGEVNAWLADSANNCGTRIAALRDCDRAAAPCTNEIQTPSTSSRSATMDDHATNDAPTIATGVVA